MPTNILKEVEYNDGKFPEEILLKAIDRKEEIIPELLGILEYTNENAEKLADEENYIAHIYALYLLAQFREQRAYPLIYNLLNKPHDVLDKLLDDVITEGLPRILASVFDGNEKPLKSIIENEQNEEFVRAAVLDSLVVLVAQGIIPRDEVVIYFQNLFHGGLNWEYSYVWDALAVNCYILHPEETFEDIELAYDKELISPTSIGFDEIKEQLTKSKESVLEELHNHRNYQLIDDTIHELEWWACFDQKNDQRITFKGDFTGDYNIKQPSVNEPYRVELHVGRNEPCPCGSGKKYKKCCGQNI